MIECTVKSFIFDQNFERFGTSIFNHDPEFQFNPKRLILSPVFYWIPLYDITSQFIYNAEMF